MCTAAALRGPLAPSSAPKSLQEGGEGSGLQVVHPKCQVHRPLGAAGVLLGPLLKRQHLVAKGSRRGHTIYSYSA